MSVKKYFGLAVLGAASLVATSAMAGGPDIAPAPDYSGFYIDGGVGYASSNWRDFIGGVFLPTGFAASPGYITSNGKGFTYGGDLGYQFNQYFSFEVGAYDLPSVTGNFGASAILGNALPFSAGGVKVDSWLLYAAAKIAIPLFQNLDWFGKAGVAWRFLSYSGPAMAVINPVTGSTFGSTVTDTHYATYMFATGMQYWITENWSVAFQYMFVNGRSTIFSFNQQAPNVNLYLLNFGYKFTS